MKQLGSPSAGGRRVVKRGAAGGAAAALLIGGLALAHAPAISLRAPSSVKAGSTFNVTTKGYFNCTRKNFHNYKCSDVAGVEYLKGTLTCPAHRFPKGGTTIDSGVGQGSDPRLREGHEKSGISTSKPGPFSAKIATKAPSATGHYTFCAYAFNFPVGSIAKVATAHVTVKP